MPGQLQPTAKALTGGRHGASSKPFTLYKLSIVGHGMPTAIVSGEQLHGDSYGLFPQDPRFGSRPGFLVPFQEAYGPGGTNSGSPRLRRSHDDVRHPHPGVLFAIWDLIASDYTIAHGLLRPALPQLRHIHGGLRRLGAHLSKPLVDIQITDGRSPGRGPTRKEHGSSCEPDSGASTTSNHCGPPGFGLALGDRSTVTGYDRGASRYVLGSPATSADASGHHQPPVDGAVLCPAS